MIWVWLLLGVVAIAIVATTIYLCVPYWRSPEKRWRDRILRAYHAEQRQVSAEASEMKRLAEHRQREEQALTEKARQRFLAGISVSELEAYPGIGPVTVSRLQQEGFTTVAKLENARIRVHGLGAKRLTDIGSAVRQIKRDCVSRFNAGACREAQELTGRLRQLAVEYEEAQCRARARAKGAAEVARQMEQPVGVARQVTFWKYFWKDAQVVVSPELLRLELPDLRAAMDSAEQKAGAAFRASQRSASTPRPDTRPQESVAVADAVPVRDVVGIASPVASPKASIAPTTTPNGMIEETPAPGRPASRAAAPASLQASPPAVFPSSESRPEVAGSAELLEATIEFAFAVARADGRIARSEKTVIEEQLSRHYAADPAMQNHVKAYCAHYETAAIDVDACIRRIKERVPGSQRGQLMEFASHIAEAAGPMNERETKFLERLSREWGVPWQPPAVPTIAAPEPKQFERAPLVAATDPPDPRALLEIDSSVRLNADLIRRQYHLLSARLAPEKVESMGQEFVAMVESKREAIRAAAEALMQPFGEPLERAEQKEEPAELRHNPDLDAMFGA